jgi:hypothetical protein
MAFHPSKYVRKAVVAGVLLSFAMAVRADGCPAWTNCPVDGAQANRVDTEYQGIVAIGVYEHTTTTGQVHRFRMRCK